MPKYCHGVIMCFCLCINILLPFSNVNKIKCTCLLQTDPLPNPQLVADVKAMYPQLVLDLRPVRSLADGGALINEQGSKRDI